MSTEYFINTSGFKSTMQNQSGGSVDLTSSFFGNLSKRWCIPFAAGFDAVQLENFGEESFSGSDYRNALGVERNTKIAGGFAYPFILTVETIDGVPNIVLYGIDLNIPSLEATGFDVNPVIINSGNNNIVRLVAGDVTTIQGGSSWQSLINDGEVKDESNNEVKDTVLFTDENDEGETKKYPMPLTLFKRADIS